jgi:hypothetical protein
LDAEREQAAVGLAFPYGLPSDGWSLRAFALGRLDDERIVRLATGLCLFDFRAGPRRAAGLNGGHGRDMPCPALDVLSLAWDQGAAAGLGARPGWAARLAANRVTEVLGEALLRLRLAGLTPLASASELAAHTPSGQRLAAALLTRISRSERLRIERSLGVVVPDTTPEEETK